MTCFILVSFLKSIVASALTIALLNFNIDLIETSRINTNIVIMGLTVYLKFIILLIVIDLGMRAKFYKNYGNSFISITLCILGLGITLAVSILLAGIIIFIRRKLFNHILYSLKKIILEAGVHFLLYYRITVGSVQAMSILVSFKTY